MVIIQNVQIEGNMAQRSYYMGKDTGSHCMAFVVLEHEMSPQPYVNDVCCLVGKRSGEVMTTFSGRCRWMR